jgi:hypothetical protein
MHYGKVRQPNYLMLVPFPSVQEISVQRKIYMHHCSFLSADCTAEYRGTMLNKTNTAMMAISTPSTPNQVMDAKEIRLTISPPIPAPTAMESCIMELFKLNITPEDSGTSETRLNCCAGADDQAAKDQRIKIANTAMTDCPTKDSKINEMT